MILNEPYDSKYNINTEQTAKLESQPKSPAKT